MITNEDIERFKERDEAQKLNLTDDVERKLQPNPFFHTPETMEELTKQLNNYNGSERAAAWMGAMMAWNYAAMWSNTQPKGD